MILYPGDKLSHNILLSDSKLFYQQDGDYRIKYITLLRDNKLTPLRGHYKPKVGDKIVGIIIDFKFPGYLVELNSPYIGFLMDDNYNLNIGDIIVAEISQVDEVNNILLINPHLLRGGGIIDIPYVKIPRVIGREGSMLSLLKSKKDKVFVGANGRIWVKGENILEIFDIIEFIEKYSYKKNITDVVEKKMRKGG